MLEQQRQLPDARLRLRRRRLERDGHLQRASSTTPAVELVGVEAGGRGLDSGRARRAPVLGTTPASASRRATRPTSCRTATVR